MIEFDDFTHNVEPFLYNIITNPTYSPSSEDFLKVVYDIYSSTTLHPERSYIKNDIDENPFNDPFERVFNLLLAYSRELFESFDISDKKAILEHLHSIKQRIKIINHAFRYLNKQIPSFILNANQCKFGYQISLDFFMAFEQYYDMLVDESICNIIPIFEDPNVKSDFTYLTNLNYICLLASKAMDSSSEDIKRQFNNNNHTNSRFDQIYEIYGHKKIIEKLQQLFDQRRKSITTTNLPVIIENFYQFLRSVKNPSTKIDICNLLYKSAIERLTANCFSLIMSVPALNLIENRKNEDFDKILQHLRVLSFHSSTHQHVEQFFTKFLDEFSKTISDEQITINNLSQKFIQFLDFIDYFNELMYEDIFNNETKKFDRFFLETTKKKFKNLKFNKALGGGTFSIALSSIIDHFMKKGDNLSTKQTSNTINLNAMIRLVSYVLDRDVFLSHHSNYMFIRIATRSTISIKTEKKFLENVQDVVKNTINFKNAFELIEQAETELLETMNRSSFNYYVIRHLYAPANRQFPSVPLPKDYKDYIDMAEKSLSAKWEKRKYEWLHYLTTLNVRITRNKRYVLVMLSLGQFAVFSALYKNPNLSKNDLHEITNIEESYLDTILKNFKSAKFIKFDDDRISLDESFTPRQAVNLCDNWTPQYAPKVKNLEVQMQRKKSVQAAIVHIMKKFKMLPTQQLVDLVTTKVSNLYEVKEEEIMAAIRELVADEYLEESDGGAQLGYIE